MFDGLPEDVLVLPSHGLPFQGLTARTGELVAHHEERLAVALEACREPIDVHQATGVLFPRALDTHQMMFAVGETLAHLNRLIATGLVERRLEAGVWRFERL